MKRVWSIVSTALVVLVILLAVALVGVRLVGLQPYVILSGSMEPVYPVGSLVYVRPVPPADIDEGDPIAFVLNEDLVVAIHRVIRIDAENEHFYTKGDANDVADAAPVHFNNLIGKPILCLPKLGYLSDYLTNPPGMYIGGAVALVILLLTFVPDLINKLDDGEGEKKANKKGKRPAGRDAKQRPDRPVERDAKQRSERNASVLQQPRRKPRGGENAFAGRDVEQRPECPAGRDAHISPPEASAAAKRRQADKPSTAAAPKRDPRTPSPRRTPESDAARARRIATERAMAEAERAMAEAETQRKER